VTASDTSAPPLDLDAIEASITACVRRCDDEEGDGCREVATHRCEDSCRLRFCDAHAEEHAALRFHDLAQLSRNAVPEARALLAEVRRLRALRDDIADAFDGLVMKVWRATGETHEPPADVAALTDRVDALRCEAESLTRRLAGRDETNANLLGRLIAAEDAIAAARREGAEAMREACAEVAAEHEAAARSRRSAFHHDDRGYDIADAAIDECEEVAAAIRALPLPEAPQ